MSAPPADAAGLAEEALIGALVSDRDAIAAVVERLRPEAFASPVWATAYRAVVGCWERRVPPDFVTVTDALVRLDPGPGVAGWSVVLLDAVGRLSEVGGWGCHAPHYADLVVTNARGRAMAAAGARLVERANRDPGSDPEAAMREALDALPSLGAATEEGPRPYADLVPEFLERVHRTWAGERDADETPTPFPGLTAKLRGGFRPGQLVILGARPGMGKSIGALECAHHAARAGKRAIFFSSEMKTEELLWRAASEVTGFPVRLAEGGRDDDAAHHRDRDRYLSMVHNQMAALPVSIDDTSGIRVAQMQARVERAQRDGPVGLVLFDYLELAGDEVRGDSEERRVGAIGKRMKHLAMVCGVPVVLLSQLGRQVESRHADEFRPRLVNLRQSGQLEADADVVLLLYRREYYVQQGALAPDPDADRWTELTIAKQRGGPTGVVLLEFDGATMTFREPAPGAPAWGS